MTQTGLSVSFAVAGVNALQVCFGDTLEPRMPGYLNALREQLLRKHGKVITQAVPAYMTLLIEYDPRQCPKYQLQQLIEREIEALSFTQAENAGRLIELPVSYGGDYGCDLETVAKACQLSVSEVIHTHSQTTYQVCALGFSPGFAYLASLPEVLRLPRRDTPRQKVRAGTLAIAAQQTAVYPLDSPGGWHLIGYCPVQWFCADKTPMTPVEVGDQVRFVEVNIADLKAWCSEHGLACREDVL